MHTTPWTKKTNAFPSDRIPPSQSYRSANTQSPKGGKGKQKSKEPPKSREVRKLEAFVESMHTSSGDDKDPTGGCFCQAKDHTLSAYTPICRECGLILCSVNSPQYCCPHCATPLLTGHLRASLVSRIEDELSQTLAKEAAERERKAEEQRQAVGAFPSLSGASTPPQTIAAPTPQTHKVLSLNSKTKKVTVSSYTPSPVSSRPESRAEESEPEIDRLPPPPVEVAFAKTTFDPSRPWANYRGERVRYVANHSTTQPEGASGGKRRRRKGGNQQSKEHGGAAVPASA